MPSLAQLPACLPRARLKQPYNDFVAPALPRDVTLALCQTEAEVGYIAAAADLEVHRVIAVTPQAACECHLRGLEYLKLEDFYDVTAFLEADEPMLGLQARWADQIDRFAWEALPELRETGLGPAGHYVFFLKVLIDSLYRAAFGLAHLLRTAEATRVVYFETSLAGPVPETLFFPRPITAAVLPYCADIYAVDLTALTALPEDQRPAMMPRDLRSAVKGLLPAGAITRLQDLKRAGPAKTVRLLRGSRDHPEIICQRAYDVEFIAERLERDGCRVTPLEATLAWRKRRSAGLRTALADLWPRLLAEEFFGAPFVWAGVDLLPIAQARLEHWWFDVVPTMWGSMVHARKRFRRRRPEAMVLYSPWTAEHHGALQAARSMDIPTVTVQHGGAEGNCEYTTYDITDLRLADCRLVYGEGTAAYMRERAMAAGRDVRIVPTGSSRLDALRSRPDHRREIRRRLGVSDQQSLVCYVAWSYQYTWYLSRNSYLGTPYFQLLTRVLEVMKRFPNHRFVYKAFPERPPDPLIRLIDRECPNVSAVTDIPFTDLLSAADAFVIDNPSTPLLEALLTAKPVLAYADNRFVTARPEATELLRRRALVSEKPDEFLVRLETFFADGGFGELADPDAGFLRAYLNDGRSAEHAASAVKALSDGWADRSAHPQMRSSSRR
jgi:hypothetical protein